MKIDIISLKHSKIELAEQLSAIEDIKQTGIIIQSGQEKGAFRSIEPSTIQALLTLSGVAVGALLKGLFDLAKEIIVFEVKQGDSAIKVEIPKNYSQEKIEQLLQLLQRANSARIIIPKD